MNMHDMDKDFTTTEAVVETSAETSFSSGAAADVATTSVVVEEMLVEEISIDGMCGVY